MSERPDLRKDNTEEKMKRKDIVATRSWTRAELESCIEDCGSVADQKTVRRLAEKLKAYLSDNDILQKLAGEIEMEPASEPAASLKNSVYPFPHAIFADISTKGNAATMKRKSSVATGVTPGIADISIQIFRREYCSTQILLTENCM